ncbi:hypothetical protein SARAHDANIELLE_116 [Hafnia phage vB_HpaM_SarahDanielle]|uniref:Phage neck terminator protein gp12-like domain-containing protein n=1 Tax=Hafnia phage vB_HpaM_SarahDanielle TaxID=2836113 RepID=A0AAE7WA90_9CAUD|nr:hypothetical protein SARAHDANIELLE_116 [Hafnia phage vB_HpaM_SarahDanielle]
MNLETTEIENGLVRTLIQVIGHRLAKDTRGRPNVIVAFPTDKRNEKGLKPDQPFITVGVVNTATPYGWILDRFVDEDNVLCYRIAFQVTVQVVVYGKLAHNILTELKQRLEFNSTREIIQGETGAVLVNTGELPNNFDYLSSDFENSAPLFLTLNVNSILKDPNGEIIERVIADGEYKYKYGDKAEYTIHLDEVSK